MGTPPSFEELSALLMPVSRQEGFLGAVALGSLSAGMQDETSDFDFVLVFTGQALAERPELAELKLAGAKRKLDYSVTSLPALLAMPLTSWETQEYVNGVVLLDTTGQVAEAVRRITHYPPEEVPRLVREQLDGYYNGVYRSLKARRRGQLLGFHAMACESLCFLSRVLFGLEGMVAPYINRFPYVADRLSRLPLPPEAFKRALNEIGATADPRVQAALFDATADMARALGYGQVLEDWGDTLEQEVAPYRDGSQGSGGNA